MARKGSKKVKAHNDSHPRHGGPGKTKTTTSSQQSTSNITVCSPSQVSLVGSPQSETQPMDTRMPLTPPKLPDLDTHAGNRNTSPLLSPLQLPNPLPSGPFGKPLEIAQAETPFDVYYRHLATKGHGSPLWIPEPSESLHIDYRREGLTIGDVIMLTAYGGFSFLFNIRRPSDHPSNIDSVPEGFSPLNPPLRFHDIQRYSDFGEDSFLTSDYVAKDLGSLGPSGIHFRSSAVEGAILALPNGAYSEELINAASFQRYIADNVVGWYKYAKEVRGGKVRNGDLRVVVGVDKSTAWEMATFATGTEARPNVQLQFRRVEHPERVRMYCWEYEGMVTAARAGPNRRQINALIPTHVEPQSQRMPSFENQCLFVRTLNTDLQDDIWKTMEDEWVCLGIPDVTSQGHGGSERSSGSASTPSYGPLNRLGDNFSQLSKGNTHSVGLNESLNAHPSSVINHFLLTKYPSAKLAITGDYDWTPLLKTTDSTLPSGNEILSRLLATHDIIEVNGIVSWKIREVTAKRPPSYSFARSTIEAFKFDPSVFSNSHLAQRRSMSVSNIEDLPPYIPHMGTKSKSTPSPGSIIAYPLTYNALPSALRSRSESCLLAESPEGIESTTGILTGPLPSKVQASALEDISMI